MLNISRVLLDLQNAPHNVCDCDVNFKIIQEEAVAEEVVVDLTVCLFSEFHCNRQNLF